MNELRDESAERYCVVCAARLGDTDEDVRLHNLWHAQLDERISLGTTDGMLEHLARDPEVGGFVRKIAGMEMEYEGYPSLVTRAAGPKPDAATIVMPVSEHERTMKIVGDAFNADCDRRENEIKALQAIVHGHVQVIRGMCTDMLDHREIDRALVRLDDAVNPPEEGS